LTVALAAPHESPRVASLPVAWLTNVTQLGPEPPSPPLPPPPDDELDAVALVIDPVVEPLACVPVVTLVSPPPPVVVPVDPVEVAVSVSSPQAAAKTVMAAAAAAVKRRAEGIVRG
jgi:hypothetical protein